MNIIGHEEARRLMEKFMDGATSNAEEAQLHEYFYWGNPARDLVPFADMMGWFADLDCSGMREDAPRLRPKRPALLRRHRLTGIAAAAVLAIIVMTAVIRYGKITQEYDTELLAMYEGSYVMCDGKKVTDLRKVMPMILNHEENIAAMRREVRSEFCNAQKEIYDQVLEYCESDVERAALISKFCENIQ